MAHSYKKSPITGTTTAKSEKFDKRKINRIIRHKVRTTMKTTDLKELEEFLEPTKDEIMDVWNMQKDGKINWKGTDFEKKALRK